MIVAGIGCRRRCPADDIVAAIRAAEAAVECTVDALAAPDFKRDEAGLHTAATLLDLPLHFVDDAALQQAQPSCVTRSALALATTGLASIAEAAALAALPGGQLVLPRIALRGATCALAQNKESTTEDTENTKDIHSGTESRADKLLRNPPPQWPDRAEYPTYCSLRTVALADGARAYPPYKRSGP